MNLRILFIITGSLILITILLFVFTSSSPQPSDTTITPTLGSSDTTPVPVNLDQPPIAGKSKITGAICLPSTPPVGFMLVAEQLPSRQRTTQYIPGPFTENVPYALEVIPGTYEIYTETPNRTKIALYSQYTVCGGDPTICSDHTPVEIFAEADKIISNIDVCDYQWSQSPSTPSSNPTVAPDDFNF